MEGKLAGALAVLVLFSAALVHAEFGQQNVNFIVVSIEPVVNVTSVTFSPSTIYSGSLTDITVNLENSGGSAANVSVNVSIFNSTGDFIENVSFNPVTVDSQTTTSITTTYNTGPLAVGTYTANTTGFWAYNATSYATNRKTSTFEIVATPPADEGGTTSGTGQPYFIPLPQVIPKKLRPVPGVGLEFAKTVVLKEITPGTSLIETLYIKNKRSDINSTVSFSVQKSPSDWLRFRRNDVVLQANEEQPIDVRIDIPENAIPGDYLAQIEASTGSEKIIDYMAIRVKPITSIPVVTKTISLDRDAGKTRVSIRLKNPTGQIIVKALVQEEIPTILARNYEDLQFLDKPGRVIQTAPLGVQFEFRGVFPQESSTISYAIDTLTEDYSSYVYWPVKQVIVPQETTFDQLVRLVEFYAPVFGFGEEKEIRARVYYSGLEPLKVNAFLDLPSGFDITPQNINTIIQPTSFITFNFKVRAPKDNAGAYVGTFSVVGNQGQIQKTTSLIVASNPVAADLSVYIAVAIGMLVLFAVFLVLRRSDGSENTGGGERIGSEERGTYLKELKGLFD